MTAPTLYLADQETHILVMEYIEVGLQGGGGYSLLCAVVRHCATALVDTTSAVCQGVTVREAIDSGLQAGDEEGLSRVATLIGW